MRLRKKIDALQRELEYGLIIAAALSFAATGINNLELKNIMLIAIAVLAYVLVLLNGCVRIYDRRYMTEEETAEWIKYDKTTNVSTPLSKNNLKGCKFFFKN